MKHLKKETESKNSLDNIIIIIIIIIIIVVCLL